MKKQTNGFTLIEMIVAMTLLTIATAATAPMIAKNRWQKDVNNYALKLEAGLLDLKANLGKQKTSCEIKFPAAYSFEIPKNLVEFSQQSDSNTTTMQCCNSEISQLTDDPDCINGAHGPSLSELTGREQDNLRMVQYESTPESKLVRIAVSTTNFGFTPPGTTLNAEQITFLICHQRSLLAENSKICLADKHKLDIRCVQIDGTGEVSNGIWKLEDSTSSMSSGVCTTT